MSKCTTLETALRGCPAGDEELLAGEPELHRHLLACGACRGRLRIAIRSGRALRRLRSDSAPSRSFFAELEAAVVGAVADLPRPRRVRRRAVAAAAAVALFALGVAIAGRSERPVGSTLVDAQPISVSDPFLFDPSSLTMPVDANAFRGLRGRMLMEQMLEASHRRRQAEFGGGDPALPRRAPR